MPPKAPAPGPPEPASAHVKGSAQRIVRLSLYSERISFRHPDRDQVRIDSVLSALGNPLRLGAVRVLDAGGEHNCGSVLAVLGVTSKSTMTHH
ncbi:hypothetical protein [Embleya hyalina]|uniref:Transcriptional regulator n=1 Tax=Embleya hyalina TaxID=516124 RepID=A0A401Z176_9ACTN|nr:hypothetical protein EHYA_08331 [Embleya hyalina]